MWRPSIYFSFNKDNSFNANETYIDDYLLSKHEEMWNILRILRMRRRLRILLSSIYHSTGVLSMPFESEMHVNLI